MASVIRPRKGFDREGRISPSQTGWEVVHAIDAGLREVDYWERHSDRLTREERSHLAHGGEGPIVRPVEPSWKLGEFLEVASNLWIKPLAVHLRADHYRTQFMVRDFRARLLRRVPNAWEPPELDEHGIPVPHTQQAIEEARIDGNYTSSAALSIHDAGDAMDSYIHDRIHGEVAAKNAIQGVKQQIRNEKLELEEELLQARRKGRKGRVRKLENRLQQHERRLKRAA